MLYTCSMNPHQHNPAAQHPDRGLMMLLAAHDPQQQWRCQCRSCQYRSCHAPSRCCSNLLMQQDTARGSCQPAPSTPPCSATEGEPWQRGAAGCNCGKAVAHANVNGKGIPALHMNRSHPRHAPGAHPCGAPAAEASMPARDMAEQKLCPEGQGRSCVKNQVAISAALCHQEHPTRVCIGHLAI